MHDTDLRYRIGSFVVNNITYTAYVFGNDGDIPHFHILSEDKTFESCVCIFEDKYYEVDSNQKLNKDQIEVLNEWLFRINEYYNHRKNYEVFAITWNNVNEYEEYSRPIINHYNNL